MQKRQKCCAAAALSMVGLGALKPKVQNISQPALKMAGMRNG
jgi:hypothetical protein